MSDREKPECVFSRVAFESTQRWFDNTRVLGAVGAVLLTAAVSGGVFLGITNTPERPQPVHTMQQATTAALKH